MTSSGQIHEKEFGKSLMNACEVLAMGDERALVFTPKTSPIKLKTYSWQDAEATASRPVEVSTQAEAGEVKQEDPVQEYGVLSCLFALIQKRQRHSR